jgi:hypothetical protein
MKYELKRVAPLRAANIGALVYGILMTVFAVVFSPFVLLASLLAPADRTPMAAPAVAALILVAYPLLGLVMGWISGLLSSAIYNVIIRLTGGLLLELDGAPAGPGGVVA